MITIFDLPLEIREMIYQHLTPPSTITWTDFSKDGFKRRSRFERFDDRYSQRSHDQFLDTISCCWAEMRQLGLSVDDQRTLAWLEAKESPECAQPAEDLVISIECAVNAHFDELESEMPRTKSELDRAWEATRARKREQLEKSLTQAREELGRARERLVGVEASKSVVRCNERLAEDFTMFFSRTEKNIVKLSNEDIQRMQTRTTDAEELRALGHVRKCELKYTSFDAADAQVDLKDEVNNLMSFLKSMHSLRHLTIRWTFDPPRECNDADEEVLHAFNHHAIKTIAPHISIFSLRFAGVLMKTTQPTSDKKAIKWVEKGSRMVPFNFGNHCRMLSEAGHRERVLDGGEWDCRHFRSPCN